MRDDPPRGLPRDYEAQEAFLNPGQVENARRYLFKRRWKRRLKYVAYTLIFLTVLFGFGLLVLWATNHHRL